MGTEIAMTQPLPIEKIGDFTLRRIIHEGVFATSLEAYQDTLHRTVFIKLLKPMVKEHERWVERFKREAQVCAQLKNPNIVGVYTIGEEKGYTYMAQEFVSGLSLQELLKQVIVISPRIAFEIVRQICLALQTAHQNDVIHRDIKPGNILIDIHGQVKLTDFGLAYLGEDAALTQQGNILGTPAYMAPEQITGDRLTPAADFFSLGATLYEMLTGHRSFAGESYSACIQKIMNENPAPPSQLQADISEQQDTFILQLVEKEPDKRPQDVSQLLEQLQSIADPESPALVQAELATLIRKYYKSEKSKSLLLDTQAIPVERSKKKWMLIGIPALLILFILLGIQLTDIPFTAPDKSEPPVMNDSLATGIGKQFSGKHALQQPKSAGPDKLPVEREEPTKPNDSPIKKNHKTNKNSDTQNSAAKTSEHLKAAKPTLELDIQPWARVELDGIVIDSMLNSTQLTLKPGNHQLVLIHPQFSPKVIQLKLEPGQERTISYSFLQDAGFLTIEVRPWAEVYIDSKAIDTTPLNRAIVLSSGQHLLELKNPYYDGYRQMITITAGDTMHIKQTLTKQ